MRRRLLILIVFCVLLTPAGHAAQDQPSAQPSFRSSVDLITLDVAAVDGKGRPVEDLKAGDFTVKVNGKLRTVVSAELIKVDRAAAAKLPASPSDALVTTNVNPVAGRRVVVGVDQTLIATAGITPLLRTAAKFVDGLAPQDYAAFIAFPEPGPRVDFTLDKARVRDAMQSLGIGHTRKDGFRSFNISLTEAIDINDKERGRADTSGSNPAGTWATLGPTYRRVLARGCQGLTGDELQEAANAKVLAECVREVTNAAVLDQTEARNDARLSLHGLEQVLAGLVPVAGFKSMVLFSAGLLAQDPSVLDEVTRLAAAARTSITVVAVDSERDQEVRNIATSVSTMALQDRSLELQGLETVADRTGGRLVRASGGAGQGIFDEIAVELSAWYVVAVERERGDPERQNIEVAVGRRGVTIRSNRTFVATEAINAKRPKAELLRDALSSPIPVPGLPLRVSTFVRRDSTAGKYHVDVAAQIGQPRTPAGEFSIGFVVLNAQGKTVASFGRQVPLAPAAGESNEPLHFDAGLVIDPGSYSLRFGGVDADGHFGTVVRPLQLAGLTGDALTTSDLMVGNTPADGEVMHPAVQPVVSSGRIAAYLELYPQAASTDGLSVLLEIAQSDASQALASGVLKVGAGARPELQTASGAIDLSLAPGRYVARATVRRDGKAISVLTRPFTFASSEPDLARAASGSGAATVPVVPPARVTGNRPALATALARVTDYVDRYQRGLSGIVVEERYVQDADKSIRPFITHRELKSDLLLVRTAGANQAYVQFRDVFEVDGVTVRDRSDRLMKLFMHPSESAQRQANEIMAESSRYNIGSVQRNINVPFVALMMLDAEYAKRFKYSVSTEGKGRPRGMPKSAAFELPIETWEIDFEETASPTVIQGDGQDAKSHGRVWIDPGTSRVLMTELVVEAKALRTTMQVSYKSEPLAGFLLPVEMQENYVLKGRDHKLEGTATYGNFRRFTVDTNVVVGDLPESPR